MRPPPLCCLLLLQALLRVSWVSETIRLCGIHLCSPES